MLTMTVSDLCCGEHWLVVNSDAAPGVYPEPLSPECFVDDLRAKGNAIGFGVEINSPFEGELIITEDVTVTGTVRDAASRAAGCRGRDPVRGW